MFSWERTISCENIIALKKIIFEEKMFAFNKTNSDEKRICLTKVSCNVYI